MSTDETILETSRNPPVYDSAHRPPAFLGELLELYRYRDLVRLWSGRNITLRYKRSILGILWTLLEPLLLMVILTIVFSTVFRFSLANYPIYLLCGLITYDFFNRSTTQMVAEITASQNLAQRIHLPRSAFALAAIISYQVSWLLAILPLAAIMLVLGHTFSWWLWMVPVAMVLLGFFALGVGLVVATVAVFFHDFKLTYSILLTALFYATPIIYPIDIVPDHLAFLFKLNPLYHLIELFRAPIYLGQPAAATSWVFAAVSSFLAAALGWWMFTRWRTEFEYRI